MSGRSWCRAAALPRVAHAEGFERYQGTQGAAFAHEAGFDAFMTGAVFATVLELQRAADAADTPMLLERPQQVCRRRPPSRRMRLSHTLRRQRPCAGLHVRELFLVFGGRCCDTSDPANWGPFGGSFPAP